VLEVLGLVQSMKNNLAPINRIPPDVFFLIPEYLDGDDDDDDDDDQNLIAMTHVCRSWRELLITRPSLWTRLYCENTDRTRVYIERSKSAPLELFLYGGGDRTYLEEAFLSVVPHIGRLKSLCIEGDIDLGNLSSLCSLRLVGVVTHPPRRNMSNLTTFTFSRVPEVKISIAQLLDFFEDAHHLRNIALYDSIPTSSDAPPGRVVSLPYLKNLTINAEAAHPVLLNHLHIPVGASLVLDFDLCNSESSLLDFLPKTLRNLENVSSITSVNLSLGSPKKLVRLDGQSGRLSMSGYWNDWPGLPSPGFDHQIVHSLSCFDLSGTRMLAVSQYTPPMLVTVELSATYRILSRMKDLRILALTQCNNIPFILALNPDKNSSKCVLCPKLEKVVLYFKGLSSFNIEELMSMAKERASAGMKLSSIMFVVLDELVPRGGVFGLREYVTRVNSRIGEEPPRWDDVPGDEDD